MSFVCHKSLMRRLTVFAAAFTLIFSMLVSASGQAKQLSLADFLTGLRSKKVTLAERNRLLAEAARSRGITFSLTPELENALIASGANVDLIAALKERTAVAADIYEREAVAEPLAPKLDFAHFYALANAKLALGETDAALENFSKALELDPANIAAYLQRGALYTDRGENAGAYNDLSKVIELDANNLIALKRRAALLEKSGENDKAFEDYSAVLKIKSDDETAKNGLARLEAIKAKALEDEKAKRLEAERAAAEAAKPFEYGAMQGLASKLVLPSVPQSYMRGAPIPTIIVFITLDTDGTVLSAKAVDGPSIIKEACERAIKDSKFNGAIVNNKLTKVSGYIAFSFKQ